jgi:hypothetical protein
MHAGTFVPLGDIGKPVGGFYLKDSKYIHERIVPPMEKLRNQFISRNRRWWPAPAS